MRADAVDFGGKSGRSEDGPRVKINSRRDSSLRATLEKPDGEVGGDLDA